MKRTQGVAIRLNRARSSMILNRFADTGIIVKRRLCVNRVTGQHQIMTFLAGKPGLEPGTDDPESSVLPITPLPSVWKFFGDIIL